MKRSLVVVLIFSLVIIGIVKSTEFLENEQERELAVCGRYSGTCPSGQTCVRSGSFYTCKIKPLPVYELWCDTTGIDCPPGWEKTNYSYSPSSHYQICGYTPNGVKYSGAGGCPLGWTLVGDSGILNYTPYYKIDGNGMVCKETCQWALTCKKTCFFNL